MKRVILTAVFALSLFAISLHSTAQEKRFNYFSTEAMDEVNATDEQRAAVKELSVRYNAKFKEIRANKSLSKEEAEAERKKVMSERAKEYWGIMTPEQAKYLKKRNQEDKARRANNSQ